MPIASAMGTGLEHAAPPGSLVEMVYENESGQVSRRRVRVIRWFHAGNGHTSLKAWCCLRDEERTFREDRVLEWRVVEEGPRQPWQPAAPRPVQLFTPVPVPAIPPFDSIVLQRPPQPRPESSAPTPRAAWRRSGGIVLSALGIGLVIVVMKGITGAGRPSPGPPQYVVPMPAPAPMPAPIPTPKPALKPAQAPRPAPVPIEAPATSDVRAARFQQATGINDPVLEALYEAADESGDGQLEWSEVRAFQQRLDREYRYLSNETALRPDEFVARGGGDCEDWALVACGLLRWWGWEGYVASFAASEAGVGHAVCLVRADEVPAGFTSWKLSGWMAGGVPVHDGRFVPIDYESVGALSNAVEPGWRLRMLHVPERIYGDRM